MKFILPLLFKRNHSLVLLSIIIRVELAVRIGTVSTWKTPSNVVDGRPWGRPSLQLTEKR